MPLFHCKECPHEWESVAKKSKCDWCDGNGFILEEKTPLELTMEAIFNESGTDDERGVPN